MAEATERLSVSISKDDHFVIIASGEESFFTYPDGGTSGFLEFRKRNQLGTKCNLHLEQSM